MTCSHASCKCQIMGCGLDHPRGWKPAVRTTINLVEVAGDDLADCVAHYLLQCGYPTDRPEELRRVSERRAASMEGRRPRKVAAQ